MSLRFAIAFVVLGFIGVQTQERAPKIDTILENDLRADLFFLASDAMRGRLAGTPENKLAAEWIKARFERLGLKPAGDYQTTERAVYWDGRNTSGESVSSGVYFYRLQAGDYSQTRKMVILK